MAYKHSVSLSNKTHENLNKLSRDNGKSKSTVVSLLIEAVCEGRVTVAEAARAIINSRDVNRKGE